MNIGHLYIPYEGRNEAINEMKIDFRCVHEHTVGHLYMLYEGRNEAIHEMQIDFPQHHLCVFWVKHHVGNFATAQPMFETS